MNREELAWAAGFFDGEGSIGTYTSAGRPKYKRIGLRVAQVNDSRVVDRFAASFPAVGTIYTGKTPKGNTIWTYHASGFRGVQYVVAQLWGFLSPVKRAQCRKALTAWLEHSRWLEETNGPAAPRVLDPEKVREIRRRKVAGEIQADLAREYGVSQQCISMVVRGLSWKSVA